MFETRIRKVGNSVVVTLSSEILLALDAREGDTVYLLRDDDGSLKNDAAESRACRSDGCRADCHG
jgi:putative addiction module antidote